MELLRDNKSLVAAFAANALIAATKFAAAAVTGSASMAAEGVHSLVDLGNAGMLLAGARLSRRPADPDHPFGHGREVYFWTLMVAVLVFGLGGGISMLEGVRHLRHPEAPVALGWGLGVLAASFLFEALSFRTAYREFGRDLRPEGFLFSLRASKDPTRFAVLFEDSAAMIGVAVAAVALTLARLLRSPRIDAAGSILIGLVLAGAALMMAYEARSLLIGEGLEEHVRRRIREAVLADPEVAELAPMLGMYLGPREVLLILSVRLRAGDPYAARVRLKELVSRTEPAVRHLYIEFQPADKRDK